jgi:protein-tyrosine-phosphatase
METPAQKFKILFLCTWNASRSIFAEYFMKDIGSGRFEALSAGVTPKGQVSPVTVNFFKTSFGSTRLGQEASPGKNLRMSILILS